MILLKACPWCNGDLYASKDWRGAYVVCFQCGHHLSDEGVVLLGCTPGQETVTPAMEASRKPAAG